MNSLVVFSVIVISLFVFSLCYHLTLAQDNPTVDFGVGAPGVKLALNTDQYFRTFEDRSHVFSILSPAGGGGRVHNLNIR